MLRLALSVAALLLANPSDTDAAAADGYWSVKTRAEPVMLGYIVPSFSTDEFVAYFMSCSKGAVTAFVDFPLDTIKHGNTYDVEMIVSGKRHRFPARAVFSEMQQYAVLEVPLDLDAPVITDLATAKTIRVNVQGQGFDLSTKKLRDSMKEFLAACPRG